MMFLTNGVDANVFLQLPGAPYEQPYPVVNPFFAPKSQSALHQSASIDYSVLYYTFTFVKGFLCAFTIRFLDVIFIVNLLIMLFFTHPSLFPSLQLRENTGVKFSWFCDLPSVWLFRTFAFSPYGPKRFRSPTHTGTHFISRTM